MPRIVAENQWLLVIDKPAGLIVHRDGRTVEPSLAEWIGQNFPELQGVGGDWVSPQGEHIALNGLVHRLDRTTSGVILVAKNQEAFEYLKSEFKNRRVSKNYLALVSGVLEGSGSIVAEIMRSAVPPKRWYARACDSGDPRAAITDWKSLVQRGDNTLVHASPKTGRTHQIRVHFASIGHPLVGDSLYGGDISKGKTPLLHAHAIALQLPDGTSATYMSETPQEFVQ